MTVFPCHSQHYSWLTHKISLIMKSLGFSLIYIWYFTVKEYQYHNLLCHLNIFWWYIENLFHKGSKYENISFTHVIVPTLWFMTRKHWVLDKWKVLRPILCINLYTAHPCIHRFMGLTEIHNNITHPSEIHLHYLPTGRYGYNLELLIFKLI